MGLQALGAPSVGALLLVLDLRASPGLWRRVRGKVHRCWTLGSFFPGGIGAILDIWALRVTVPVTKLLAGRAP